MLEQVVKSMTKEIMGGKEFGKFDTALRSKLIAGKRLIPLWRTNGSGIAHQLYSDEGPVMVPSYDVDVLPAGAFFQKDVLLVKLKYRNLGKGRSMKEWVLVPSLEDYDLICDERVETVLAKFEEEPLAAAIFTKGEKRVEACKKAYVDKERKFLYCIRILLLSEDELRNNLELFLESRRTRLPIIVANEKTARAFFLTEKGIEVADTSLDNTKVGKLFRATITM